MIELVMGLVSGFALGFSLMTYRLVKIEKKLTDDLVALIEQIKEVRP
jgi:hypothetical protein